jgi:hypothetical protein
MRGSTSFKPRARHHRGDSPGRGTADGHIRRISPAWEIWPHGARDRVADDCRGCAQIPLDQTHVQISHVSGGPRYRLSQFGLGDLRENGCKLFTHSMESGDVHGGPRFRYRWPSEQLPRSPIGADAGSAVWRVIPNRTAAAAPPPRSFPSSGAANRPLPMDGSSLSILR